MLAHKSLFSALLITGGLVACNGKSPMATTQTPLPDVAVETTEPTAAPITSPAPTTAPVTLLSAEAGVKTVVIPIEGMSCGSCAARIKSTLKSITGVEKVEVHLGKRSARVVYDSSVVSPRLLVSTIDSLGYRAGSPQEELALP